MARLSLLLAVIALAMSGGAAAHASSDLFGVSVNRIVNDDFTPAHWDAPLSAVRASGITQARTDAFWMWAESGPHRRFWGGGGARPAEAGGPPLRLAPARRRGAGAGEPPAAVAADPRLLG